MHLVWPIDIPVLTNPRLNTLWLDPLNFGFPRHTLELFVVIEYPEFVVLSASKSSTNPDSSLRSEYRRHEANDKGIQLPFVVWEPGDAYVFDRANAIFRLKMWKEASWKCAQGCAPSCGSNPPADTVIGNPLGPPVVKETGFIDLFTRSSVWNFGKFAKKVSFWLTR